jgi:hypothetical protein
MDTEPWLEWAQLIYPSSEWKFGALAPNKTLKINKSTGRKEMLKS